MGKNRIIVVVLLLILTMTAFGAGYGTSQRSQAASSTRTQGMRLLDALLNRVHEFYIDPSVDEQQLFIGAAKGMLDALGDPYTRFLDPRAYQDFRQDVKGFFFGIGIYIELQDNHLIVVQPIKGTPADRAGLRAGDRILKIGGTSTEGMALQEAVTRIRGPKGSAVTLALRRADREFEASIVRDRIEASPGEGAESLDDATRTVLKQAGIGYIKLTTFNNENTAKTFDRLFADVQRAGAKGLILDLRHNGGGLLDISLEVVDRFVPAGQPMVHEVDRKGHRTTERAGSRPKVGIPVVVLVDEFTASASEIVSGALQDSGVATLVGVKTFGKGVIQTVVELPQGAGAVITSAKYLTPKERDIHKKGIVPDILVGEPEESLRTRLRGKLDAEIDQQVEHMKADQLNRAIDTLKKKFTKSEQVPVVRAA